MARIFQKNERPHTDFKNILKVNNLNVNEYIEDDFNYDFEKYEQGRSLEDRPGENEPFCCTFFGCGKRLSMRQSMAGNRCEDHPKGMKHFNNLPL